MIFFYCGSKSDDDLYLPYVIIGNKSDAFLLNYFLFELDT